MQAATSPKLRVRCCNHNELGAIVAGQNLRNDESSSATGKITRTISNSIDNSAAIGGTSVIKRGAGGDRIG